MADKLYAYVNCYRSDGNDAQVVYESTDDGENWSSVAAWGTNKTFLLQGDRHMHGVGYVVVLADENSGVLVKFDEADSFSPVVVPGSGGVPASAIFYSVFVVASDDIWAVGSESEVSKQILIYHWDGVTWTDVSAAAKLVRPNAETAHCVWANGSNDVWIVGDDSGTDSFVLHWNGAAWSDRTPATGMLHSVFGFASDDVWICGEYGPKANVLQWTGSGWVDRSDATLDASFYSWQHIGGSSSSDLWLAGLQADVAHWDGAVWSIITPDNGPDSVTGGVLQIGDDPKDLWLFGNYRDSSSPPNLVKSDQPPLTAWLDKHITAFYSPNVLGLHGVITPPLPPLQPVIVSIQEGYGASFSTAYDGYDFVAPYDAAGSKIVVVDLGDDIIAYDFTIEKQGSWPRGQIGIRTEVPDGYAGLDDRKPRPGAVDQPYDFLIEFRVTTD